MIRARPFLPFHLSINIRGGRQLVRHWFENQLATGLAPAADTGSGRDVTTEAPCLPS